MINNTIVAIGIMILVSLLLAIFIELVLNSIKKLQSIKLQFSDEEVNKLKEIMKEFQKDPVDTIPDEVDELEIAEHVKNTFLNRFCELAWNLCHAFNVTGIIYSIEDHNPYKLRLCFGKYELLIQMDPGTYRFTILEEGFVDGASRN